MILLILRVDGLGIVDLLGLFFVRGLLLVFSFGGRLLDLPRLPLPSGRLVRGERI